jgi:hypothetical protein
MNNTQENAQKTRNIFAFNADSILNELQDDAQKALRDNKDAAEKLKKALEKED